MITRPCNFVFDLDDTLYKERSYSVSCLTYIGAMIAKLYGVDDPGPQLVMLFERGEFDPIKTVCGELGIGDNARQSLLSGMQAHLPVIELSPDAAGLITAIRQAGQNFSIITDGRSVTQRAKMASLGLLSANNIMISDEIGFKKPDQSAFKNIQGEMKADTFVYVADNPRKDFIAPNELGWNTIMLKDDGSNIHPQDDNISEPACAKQTVLSLRELIEYV